MEQMRRFADTLLELMMERALNNAELARLLSVTEATVHNWLKGSHEPKYEAIQKMVIALNISPEHLLGLPETGYWRGMFDGILKQVSKQTAFESSQLYWYLLVKFSGENLVHIYTRWQEIQVMLQHLYELEMYNQYFDLALYLTHYMSIVGKFATRIKHAQQCLIACDRLLEQLRFTRKSNAEADEIRLRKLRSNLLIDAIGWSQIQSLRYDEAISTLTQARLEAKREGLGESELLAMCFLVWTHVVKARPDNEQAKDLLDEIEKRIGFDTLDVIRARYWLTRAIYEERREQYAAAFENYERASLLMTQEQPYGIYLGQARVLVKKARRALLHRDVSEVFSSIYEAERQYRKVTGVTAMSSELIAPNLPTELRANLQVEITSAYKLNELKTVDYAYAELGRINALDVLAQLPSISHTRLAFHFCQKGLEHAKFLRSQYCQEMEPNLLLHELDEVILYLQRKYDSYLR